MSGCSRRSFLTGMGALAGTGILGLHAPGSAKALDMALTNTLARTVSSAGTTLEQAAAPVGIKGYRRLAAGPGYHLIVRQDLVKAKSDRDSRRHGLASFVQVTDIHMLDAQSPMRVEWMHDITGSAFRPQEALGTHGATSLVRRINALPGGPYTGRRFDCVVSTGDNTDNHEHVELTWFLTVLAGGTLTANTGGPQWEGVQAGDSTMYWLPEKSTADRYKKAGFPTIPGYFARAVAPHRSPGLQTPWYSVFGNHDDSIMGTLPSSWSSLTKYYTSSRKVLGLSSSDNNAMARAIDSESGSSFSSDLAKAFDRARLSTTITADERRRPFTPREYIAAHRSAQFTGAGPFGHGFDEEAEHSARGYYTFTIAPGVRGISLDSTNRAGFTEGSLGKEQFTWLEKTLGAGSSRYYDTSDRLVRQHVSDELFVVFSHHTGDTMTNLMRDPAVGEERFGGAKVIALLQRFPNVLAWVNGHTHANAITPRPHNVAARGFWEINTASHIDFPQHARVLEVVDNRDATLSIFTTLIESDAPYRASYTSSDPRDLAALYRELSFNDLHADLGQLGTARDRNTELLLVNPLGRTV